MKKLFITPLLPFSLVLVLLLTACTSHPVSIETLLHAELEVICIKHNLPGMTAAIILDDGTTISVAWGMADKEYSIPMTPQSRMLAASIGKSFVAATCVALANEGILDLDRLVAVWLEEYPWFDRLPNRWRVLVTTAIRKTMTIAKLKFTFDKEIIFEKNGGD